MNRAMLVAAGLGWAFASTQALAQTVSDALLQQATLGSNLSDYTLNTALDNAAGNTDPLFTVVRGQQLLFGIGATGTFADTLSVTFGGSFYTLADPNVAGVVVYPISTRGGNSYRELLTFSTLGSFSGTITPNLTVANPDYSYNGGSARREAPTFTFRVNVVDATAAVPEPASWAMLVVGFGALGGALRRRSVSARIPLGLTPLIPALTAGKWSTWRAVDFVNRPPHSAARIHDPT